MQDRINRKNEIINALTNAQKLAFAPLTFQALATMLELGILKEIDKTPLTFEELMSKFNYSKYIVKTLLEVAQSVDLVKIENEKIYITKLAQAFLYDEMTIANFNFVKDVCYLGANELTSSFLEKKPNGFKKIFKEADTIYPYLSKLPEKMQKSWYEFDHYYSDNCFELVYEIITKENSNPIFDIGGNMGAFEKVCLKNNPNIDISMIDLPLNIDYIKNDVELKNCKFYKADILSNDELPKMSGSVLMSQFLDCFDEENIIKILKKINANSTPDIKVFILEPFIDKQKFDGAKLSLIHTSLYFTCMANGYSKMYSSADMEEFINIAGFKIDKIHSSIGAHDYTLLECVKNV